MGRREKHEQKEAAGGGGGEREKSWKTVIEKPSTTERKELIKQETVALHHGNVPTAVASCR